MHALDQTHLPHQIDTQRGGFGLFPTHWPFAARLDSAPCGAGVDAGPQVASGYQSGIREAMRSALRVAKA